MAHQFCDHLDEYGVQYTRTEASYRQCIALVDRILAEGPTFELVGLVNTALQEWAGEDRKLRDMLVSEVAQGRVRVPNAITPGHSPSHRRQSRKSHSCPVCSTCRFEVPRLEYPEWKIAHNGEASFRGQDFLAPVTH